VISLSLIVICSVSVASQAIPHCCSATLVIQGAGPERRQSRIRPRTTPPTNHACWADQEVEDLFEDIDDGGLLKGA